MSPFDLQPRPTEKWINYMQNIPTSEILCVVYGTSMLGLYMLREVLIGCTNAEVHSIILTLTCISLVWSDTLCFSVGATRCEQ